MLSRTSPSPSPSRRPPRTRPELDAGEAGEGQGQGQGEGEGAAEDEDEDEETLQLKLQEIQARLRLKRLQNARSKDGGAPPSRATGGAPRAAASTGAAMRTARAVSPAADASSRLAAQKEAVQVPASPIRKAQPAPPAPSQTSPSRVLLGIDKGLRAKDVSLKRAPSHKGAAGLRASQSAGYLDRSRSSAAGPATAEGAAQRQPSFSERLASARADEAFRASRDERIRRVRTNAFGIGRQEMDEYKKSATDISDEPIKPPSFTRQQVLSQEGKRPGRLPRSETAPDLAASQSAAGDADEESASFEPYSCFHLSRRILPHRVLARHVSGKKTMSIKELLRDVKGPDFSLPDVEQDIVTFAIVARKSEPRTHKQGEAKAGERGKYMVMTLCDLDLELDLFLFDSGFTRFWKLTEGTVVAILNPGVMPPPPGRQDTGRFSLVINSDDDSVMEIGASQVRSRPSLGANDMKRSDSETMEQRKRRVCEQGLALEGKMRKGSRCKLVNR